MADSSPLPSQSNSNVGREATGQAYSATTSPFRAQSNTNNLSLDDFMENCLRGFSCRQVFQAILVSMPLFFDAQQALITVFTDAEPANWHCRNSTRSGRTYDVSAKTSVISEWGLECASSVLTVLPASSFFFMGCLVGGFILSSTLGDSVLGRKSLLFLSCFGMSVTALATSFSNNPWVYSALRFTTGAFRSSIVTTALALLTEMVAKQWRSLVSIMPFCFFSVGILSLPAVAYANEGSSWRLLYLWTSVPAMIYCIAGYFIVCESPRWLFIHGRQAEAVAILKKLSTTSHGDSPNSYFSSIPHLQQAPSVDHQSSIKSLFQRKWAVHRLLGTMVLAFGAGMVYYGSSLGVGNLHFNLYLSVAFNGILDLPAFLLTFIFLKKSNRRTTILASCILSGSCSLVCAVISSNKLKVLEIGSELAAIFAGEVATNLVLIYATELFPTSVRNTATSMVRQALIFGAMCSPVLISAGRKSKLFSYGVFGSVIILCSFFVISLPETKGVTLSDTLDEQEEKDKSHTRT